jgi:hypothetical protein
MALNTKATWWGKGAEPPPSNQEMLDCCIANAEAAAKAEQKARADYRAAEIGSKDLRQASYDIHRFGHDQVHWRKYVAFYRGELAKERATDVAAGTSARPAAPVEHHRNGLAIAVGAMGTPPRQERVAGADDMDEDEVRQTAWQELHG